MNSDRNTLTEGPIWQKMLLFALPVLLGNILQQFYNTFDTWVVGKFLGDNALAAVSSSGSLIFMIPMFIMLGCWCLLRVSYITIAVGYINQLETVSRAYPITWNCSSILFLLYFLKADRIHSFERYETKPTH